MRKLICYISALSICLFLFCSPALSQVRVLTIGDSTMADYDEEKNSGENEMRGWAQMLPIFFDDSVIVDNAAKNGRSSKSFYLEFWDKLRESLKPGDYVFIQFGHNDEKAKGMDAPIGNPKERGTAAWGQYQQFLTIYVEESRAKGAIPILLTPVVRGLFDENGKINDTGMHNLSEYCQNDSAMNYPLAMRALAHKLSVPLIDMTELTRGLVEEYGPTKSKEVIYCNKDNTHLKAMGGILFAQLAAKELSRQNILSDYLVLQSGIRVLPTGNDFGKQFVGKLKNKSFSIIGLSLQPQSGTIKLSTQSPFFLSETHQKDYFASEADITYSNGNIYKPINISFHPSAEGNIQSPMHIVTNNKESQPVLLKGIGLSLDGYSKIYSLWQNKLSKPKASKGLDISSQLAGLQKNVVSDKAQIYTPDKIWPSDDIDINTSRYVEYSVTAKAGDLYIDSVRFDISASADGIFFTALGSVDASFSNPVTLAAMIGMNVNEDKTYASETFIELSKGKTFYLRIYPWSRKTFTDNFFTLNNVSISGMMKK